MYIYIYIYIIYIYMYISILNIYIYIFKHYIYVNIYVYICIFWNFKLCRGTMLWKKVGLNKTKWTRPLIFLCRQHFILNHSSKDLICKMLQKRASLINKKHRKDCRWEENSTALIKLVQIDLSCSWFYY